MFYDDLLVMLLMMPLEVPVTKILFRCYASEPYWSHSVFNIKKHIDFFCL